MRRSPRLDAALAGDAVENVRASLGRGREALRGLLEAEVDRA